MRLASFVVVSLLLACGGAEPPVRLTDEWPSQVGDYEDVAQTWTRRATMRGEYQEALEVVATFKSTEFRAAHASKDAAARGLVGAARDQRLAQARADAAGPYEFEVMVTTWDRRENDLDRGTKSIWKVRMLDASGAEIEPLEIIKDKRPAVVVRADYPALGEFATAYVVRFPRTKPLFGTGAAPQMRMRFSSARGGVDLIWTSGAP